MNHYTVYVHINKSNLKAYPGYTSAPNPKYRWNNGKGYKDNSHFWGAIQKYGWDGFLHIIIRTGLTFHEAEELEKKLIYLYRACDPNYGYNYSEGGGGFNQGKECYTPEKQKEYHTRNNHSECHKISQQKYDKSEKGKENRRKYRDNNREKLNERNEKYRKEHPEWNLEVKSKWRAENPEKVRNSWKKYYESHKEELKKRREERKAIKNK